MTSRQFLSGNEAIARGAWEAGVHVAAGYPGTPATEIIENLARYEDIDVEWSNNEKVAFDVAYGACLAGARALVAIKHVGVNVALDSIMVTPFSGVHGGLVIVTADDPGMHSSQNEQDNRLLARFAKIPMLEPSDSEEARQFVKLAFELSEQFDIPVFLRTTTRTAHSKSLANLEEPQRTPPQPHAYNAAKHVVPIYGKRWRRTIDERIHRLGEMAETLPQNRVEDGDPSIGVVTSGISYQYAKEIFPQARILKLGMIYPLPGRLITDFCATVEKVYVIEELEPFLEEQLKLLGVRNLHGSAEITGKDQIPNFFELTPDILRRSLLNGDGRMSFDQEIAIPPRPPVLCPGCPHSGMYAVLQKMKVAATGDIGCYTLGALPPFNVLQTTFCMGAGVANAFGIEKVLGRDHTKKLVAVIGDSTFLHSGLSALIDIVFNRGFTTVILMDNSTTGMTGHQQHPGMGKTLRDLDTHAINYEELIRAIGVKHVSVVDPYDLNATETAVRKALDANEPSVVISRRPCVLLESEKAKPKHPHHVLSEECQECSLCLEIGCPALDGSEPIPSIARDRCIGCDLCAKLCPFDAILPVPN